LSPSKTLAHLEEKAYDTKPVHIDVVTRENLVGVQLNDGAKGLVID